MMELVKKLAHYKGAIYTLYGNSYESLVWQDTKIPKPTLEELENLPEPLTPNWKNFRTALSQNLAFNRIRIQTLGTPAQLAGEWLAAAAAIESNEWEAIAARWNVLIDYAPAPPTSNEVEEWQQQANQCQMPLTFNPNGHMVTSTNILTFNVGIGN